MKPSQDQNRQGSASGQSGGMDVELSDDMLDTITGGGSDAMPADIEPEPVAKPINDLVGRVVSKNFA